MISWPVPGRRTWAEYPDVCWRVFTVGYWCTVPCTDNLTIFADAINITDETTYVYGRSDSQPLFVGQQGARYNVGVRYTF